MQAYDKTSIDQPPGIHDRDDNEWSTAVCGVTNTVIKQIKWSMFSYGKGLEFKVF